MTVCCQSMIHVGLNVSGQTKTLLGVRSIEVRINVSQGRGWLDGFTRVTKSRSIQDVSSVFWEKIRSDGHILPQEDQVVFVGFQSRKHNIMWKIRLNRLPKLFSPLDFFVGDCKQVLIWVPPCIRNQQSCARYLLKEDIHGPLSRSSFTRCPYQNM